MTTVSGRGNCSIGNQVSPPSAWCGTHALSSHQSPNSFEVPKIALAALVAFGACPSCPSALQKHIDPELVPMPPMDP